MSDRDAEMDWAELRAARETINRLRAELAAMVEHYHMLELDHAVEVRAIARVRELCADESTVFRTTGLRRALLRDDILDALDGGDT